MANTEPTTFDRIRDVVHSYDAAEGLAREMAEQALTNLGVDLTAHRSPTPPQLPEEAIPTAVCPRDLLQKTPREAI